MDIIKPVSEVRQNLPALLKRINREGKHLVITKNGRPTAVMITPEELETLEIMADKELMEKIERGAEDIKNGRFRTFEEVFKDV